LQKYTVRVKKPESKIFKLFDPGRASLQKYTVRVKKPEIKIFKFFDPSRVFQRARELAEIYGSGQKTGKQHLLVFCPEPCISASSSLQNYTVRVTKPENNIFNFLTRH
jgi:hypothetical protein